MSAMRSPQSNSVREGLRLIRRHRGPLRMSEALRLGLSRWLIYRLHDKGYLERISRGLYRLTESPEPTEPDLITVACRAPQGVVCLISALSFHELTTQVPHHIDLAIQRGQRPPVIDYPPTQIYKFSRAAFTAGIEIHRLDGVDVKIYSREKTVADIFKYRNKLGLDVAIESLWRWHERKDRNLKALTDFAKIDRVETVMRPYLEVVL